MEKKYQFHRYERDNQIHFQATFVSAEVILTKMLNEYPGFTTSSNSDLEDLIADVTLLTSLQHKELKTKKLLHTEIDTEDGQLRILDEDGHQFQGDFNIEQLLIAKSPRIPWELEGHYEILIYSDIASFYTRNYIDSHRVLVDTMKTTQLLKVLIKWNDFLNAPTDIL